MAPTTRPGMAAEVVVHEASRLNLTANPKSAAVLGTGPNYRALCSRSTGVNMVCVHADVLPRLRRKT